MRGHFYHFYTKQLKWGVGGEKGWDGQRKPQNVAIIKPTKTWTKIP